MRSRTRTALVLALVALPASLVAQGVTIQSTVDTRLEGALGTAARVAARFGGSSLHDVPTTTYLSGHRLRTESGTTATIIDADAGRITSIDDKARTWTSMTFDEMAAAMKKAQDDAKARQTSSSSGSNKNGAPAKGDLDVTYTVSAERPGQHETVAGYDAERVFLTITMKGTAKPEGEQAQEVGSMVFLVDQWVSKSAPQTKAMAEFQRAYAKKAGQAFSQQARGLQGLMAVDPRMMTGLDAAAKEMARVQGTPLRSVIHVTLVPAGMAFDRALALGDASASAAVAANDAKADAAKPPEAKKGRFGSMMGRLKDAAAEASKRTGSEPKPDAPPHQSTLMTISDEVKSISAGAVPASTFTPPADYREVKPTQT